MKSLSITSWALLLIGISLRAAPVRISFLTDESALRETVDLLVQSGCHREGIDGFKKSVVQFSKSPLQLDLSKFPQIRNGFYFFPSITNLADALPPLFCQTGHEMVINCFDTALLLTKDQLSATPKVGEDVGPFVVEVKPSITNDCFQTLAATPEDAFQYVCPEWYRRVSEGFIPKSLQSQRCNLIAALQRFYVLPLQTIEGDSAQAIERVLTRSWRKMGLNFPTNCELVLCHSHLSPVEVGTIHAGVLFWADRHFVYIEKTGIEGPFVRLDFADRADLSTWLATHMAVHLGNKAGQFFVTFNDKSIERLAIPKPLQVEPVKR